FLVK
ncbi:hypothetical protein E2320_009781, partial [Naja naja]